MSTMADKVLAVARGEVGTHEAKAGGHWNNLQKYSREVPGLAWSEGQPWCQVFVTWVAMTAEVQGLYHPVASPTASCDAAGAWFKKVGRWSELPAVGAQVFFGSPRDLCHTGIVVGYDGASITTVEGNTNASGAREGDGVYLKTHRRRDPRVVGYGYPDFEGGIVSADPSRSSRTHSPPHVDPTGPVARIDGIDLSHHNTRVTLSGLQAAREAGVRFVSHKATEGNGFSDAQYGVRRRLAAAAGIPFGGYHFARPAASSGRVQAQKFLAAARPQPGDLAPMLDLEDRGGLRRARLTTWVGNFVDEVRRQAGVLPVIYTPFDLDDNFGCLLWVARYNDAMIAPKVPSPWTACDIWQFSNGVLGQPRSVPGVGHVDISTFGVDLTGPGDRLFVPATVPVDAPVDAPVVPGAAFCDVTANVQHTDPAAQTTHYIDDIAAEADLIGWQEIQDRDEVAALHALPGFDHYLPGGAASAVAISWRTDVFEQVGTGESIEVHPGQSHITPSRYINVVRLRHKPTGKVVARVNTQVVSHIEVAGRPRVYTGAEVSDYDEQLARAKKHIALLRTVIERYAATGPVVFGGDLNIDYKAERRLPTARRTRWFPLTVLSQVLTLDMPGCGTHGSREIDWSGHTDGLSCTEVHALAPGSSDHRAVLKTYELAA